MYTVLLFIIATFVLLFLMHSTGGETRIEMPSGNAARSEDPIEDALLSGRKIEAIKLYRERHRVGLKEAKDAVEEMGRSLTTP